MNVAKHTPGPWNLHPVLRGLNDIKCECDGESFLYSDRYIAKGEKAIARVDMMKGHKGGFPKVDNREEFLANVDLMLAAPEMYARLEELMGWFEEEGYDGEAYSLEKLLKKARGES